MKKYKLIAEEILEEYVNAYSEVDLERVAKILKEIAQDTAKEIWNDITSYYFGLRVLGNATVELDKLAEFWHKRGVEVE